MTTTAQGPVALSGRPGTTGLPRDLRGLRVLDADGEVLGRVDDLLIDHDVVRFLIVASAGFLGIGVQRSPLPVDAVTGIADNQICIAQSRERVLSAPAYQPGLVDDRDYRERVFVHYGYPPYWTDGHRPEDAPVTR